MFKKEVFNIQKKYKDERAFLNKSFQKIQKDIKDLLAQIIKEVSLKKILMLFCLKKMFFYLIIKVLISLTKFLNYLMIRQNL